jgi:hypothetical protein
MKPREIVIVGHEEHDLTLMLVRERLSKIRNVFVVVLNGQEFGASLHPSVSFRSQSFAKPKIIFQKPGSTIQFDAPHSIWYRRWHPPLVVNGIRTAGGHQQFAWENWDRFADGIWLCAETLWVNHPFRSHEASNKLYQIKMACSLGFSVPATLFTSDPSEARNFIDAFEHGVVCKSIGNHMMTRATKTVLLKPKHVAALEDLAACPAIFQQFIPVDKDIRITVVEDECFAGEVDTLRGKDPIDWRDDVDNPWRKHRLPPKLEAKCIEMTRLCGLKYSAIDMRLSPDGEYYFFEINPAGQFLFLEAWTGLPISSAIANLLARG